jgi:hypothetical protein
MKINKTELYKVMYREACKEFDKVTAAAHAMELVLNFDAIKKQCARQFTKKETRKWSQRINAQLAKIPRGD